MVYGVMERGSTKIYYIFVLSLSLFPPSLSGYVCVWDIHSSLLMSDSPPSSARQQLHPLIQIVSQDSPCRALAWCPHDSNYLATGTQTHSILAQCVCVYVHTCTCLPGHVIHLLPLPPSCWYFRRPQQIPHSMGHQAAIFSNWQTRQRYMMLAKVPLELTYATWGLCVKWLT